LLEQTGQLWNVPIDLCGTSIDLRAVYDTPTIIGSPRRARLSKELRAHLGY